MYGIFDFKWLFVGNVILFEAGSAICGAAPSMNALIIGRVVVGIGGCGMYSGCLTYIAALTSLPERPIYTAGVALGWGVGSVLGPVVSITASVPFAHKLISSTRSELLLLAMSTQHGDG